MSTQAQAPDGPMGSTIQNSRMVPQPRDSANISRLQGLNQEISSNLSNSNVNESSTIHQGNGKKIPQSNHYEVPSLSSMLYEYTNKEQDSVLNAFRTGNFNSIRDLPDNIAPNNVLQQLQIKMKQELAISSVIS